MAEPHPEFPPTHELTELMARFGREPSKAGREVAELVGRTVFLGDTAGLSALSLGLERAAGLRRTSLAEESLDSPRVIGLNDGWPQALALKEVVDVVLRLHDGSEDTQT